MSLAVGDPIPPFALPSDGCGMLTVGDLRGQITVLYFYPKDGTAGCTQQARAFCELSSEFAEAGVRVIGVSADSVASHDRFKAKHGLTMTFLSDCEKQLARAFGVWVEKRLYGKTFMGIERATFLVDRLSVVRHVWRKVKIPGHAEEDLRVARTLAEINDHQERIPGR